MKATAPPRSRFLLVCDHCGEEFTRKPVTFGGPVPWPDGWRRVDVGDGETVTECPDCAIAWDVAASRPAAEWAAVT